MSRKDKDDSELTELGDAINKLVAELNKQAKAIQLLAHHVGEMESRLRTLEQGGGGKKNGIYLPN